MEAKGVQIKEVCTQCGKCYPEGTGLCPQDGNELMCAMSDPLIGAVLPRKYRVISLLGRGSMSVVYKGVYEPLEQPVAIKMLKAHLVSDPQQAKRFQQEIKAAGTLDHKNIVGILDFGVTEQGVPYLIMEHLDGKSLADILDKEDRLSVNRIIKIFSQAAGAFGFAHGAGVIHRDIKPSNLVLVDREDERDIVKVVDFGIAKLISEGDTFSGHASGNAALTATGEVIGTPLYMSPEQANGRDLDLRSDIYSLGCVIYHAITGRPPFVGDTAIDTIRLQITATPPQIDKVRPDLYIPGRLQSIVVKCLQKDPRLRYQSMDHLQSDLESCDPRGDSATTAQLRVSRPIGMTAVPDTLFEDNEPRKLPSMPVVLVILAALGTIGFAAFTFLSDSAHRRSQAMQQAAPVQVAPSPAAPSANPVAATPEQQAQTVPANKIDDATTEKTWLRDLAAAKAAVAKGDFKDADDLLMLALPGAEISAGAESADVADIVEELAVVRENEAQLPSAEELFNRALLIRQKSLGSEDPKVADTLCALGALEYKVRRDASAETMFKNALAIRQKAFGEHSSQTAEVYGLLANFYSEQKRKAEADAANKKAQMARGQ